MAGFVFLALLGLTMWSRRTSLEQRPVRYFFIPSQERGRQQLAVVHSALGTPQDLPNLRGEELGDEVMDLPQSDSEHDDGDMYVPAEMMNSYTFKQKPVSISLATGNSRSNPMLADPSDPSMYDSKLAKLGVNVGAAPAQGSFATHGDAFVSADNLEDSYSVGPSPNREIHGNTIGGDWFGHVGEPLLTRAQIQAQSAVPKTAKFTSLAGQPPICQCSASTDAAATRCSCQRDASRLSGSKTISLDLQCCDCGGKRHIVSPAPVCSDCYGCGQQAYHAYYNPYGIVQDDTDEDSSTASTILEQKIVKPVHYFSRNEDPGKLTDRMMVLNDVLRGAKNFKPPTSAPVYESKIVKRVKVDPIVQLS
uniref:Uncharacterized protein n=1 Tax=Guillardia theta TaxID=55529 RepID=A0A7S4N383_GUITH|mmetsp:Transcript_16047/g.53800  ORF Transcript_16047/g.53800 Transcript_16047/m.53800 type:complete len:364 (+) Transcript_16047:2-1093(+)